MAKDPIKKAENGTYYFRANLRYNHVNRFKNTAADSQQKKKPVPSIPN